MKKLAFQKAVLPGTFLAGVRAAQKRTVFVFRYFAFRFAYHNSNGTKSTLYFRDETREEVPEFYEILLDEYDAARRLLVPIDPDQNPHLYEEQFKLLEQRSEDLQERIESLKKQLEKETVWRICSWLK